jgi:hypothetical protein
VCPFWKPIPARVNEWLTRWKSWLNQNLASAIPDQAAWELEQREDRHLPSRD